jgi:ribosomal protein S19
VKLLLAHPQIRVNEQNQSGQTATWVAITEGHSGILKLLLAHKNMNVIKCRLTDGEFHPPLVWALRYSNNKAVRLLMAHGADVEDTKRVEWENEVGAWRVRKEWKKQLSKGRKVRKLVLEWIEENERKIHTTVQELAVFPSAVGHLIFGYVTGATPVEAAVRVVFKGRKDDKRNKNKARVMLHKRAC